MGIKYNYVPIPENRPYNRVEMDWSVGRIGQNIHVALSTYRPPSELGDSSVPLVTKMYIYAEADKHPDARSTIELDEDDLDNFIKELQMWRDNIAHLNSKE